MSKPWMISVLSTAYDLSDYREALISMLKEKRFEVSAYELPEFPVEYDKHSHDSCLIALDRVDMAITIIDKRSGGVYCGVEDQKKGISITEAEYLEAIKKKKPVFSCVRQEAYNELHRYKKEFAEYCKKNRISKDNIDEGIIEFDKTYTCSYVENVQTLHFIDDIQKSYSNNNASNWMSFFSSIDDLLKNATGKLTGYSRALMQKLSEVQKEKLLDRHTSTAIGMSLRDVFSEGYYIAPPYTVESGKRLIDETADELSKSVEKADKSILIYGEAGYGKTTVIAKCFVDQVEAQKENPSYAIPMFLPLKNKGSNYSFDLLEYLNDDLSELWQKDPYPYLNVDRIDFRFYCDGFDELAESFSEQDIEQIRKSSIFKYPILLTCRQQFVTRYLNVHNFSDIFSIRIQMQKWDIDTVEKYVDIYCDRKKITNKDDILSSIRKNDDLLQIINSPLLTTMFLWFLENEKDIKAIKDISTVKLFESWMKELSSREHSKRNQLPSNTILEVWKCTAWKLYLQRKSNQKLFKDEVLNFIRENFQDVIAENLLATFDTLFEWKSDCLIGTFHEQFMEYLVATLLIDACRERKEPYPEFLKIVLRPEINRYFREIWKELSNTEKQQIYESIEKQYFENVGETSDDGILIRVHSVYHMCRLESMNREKSICRAFESEKNISVLLSLYFGAIKLGQLDKEETFYNLLSQDDYSRANRGYHLTYYADMPQNGVLPYFDNGNSDWQGTLKAFERHFHSGKLEHFFLWRIDLYTMKELLKERRKTFPLTSEIIAEISSIISSHSFQGYDEFYKKVEQEMISLIEVFKDYNK